MIISAFAVGAITVTGTSAAVSGAVADALFTAGLGAIFGALFTGALRKTSAKIRGLLGFFGLGVALFCLSLMNQQQDLPVIFSPALLAYPALGLVFACVLQPLLESSENQ